MHACLIEGSGSVVDPHPVEVQSEGGKTRRITAKHILIAAGGRAVKAPIEGAVRTIGFCTVWCHVCPVAALG